MMIDFIKKNIKYDRIEVYLLYDKIENKFFPNNEAKSIFQNLGFKWLCVVGDEKQQQRYIKLYYCNKECEDKDNNNKNINNFFMENLSAITVNNEELFNLLKSKINNKSDDNKLYKVNYNKFINPNPIYSLLFENSRIKNEFINDKKRLELTEIKEKLWKFVTIENGWNQIEEEKKKIKKENLKFDLKTSVFKELERFFMSKEKNEFYFSDLYNTKLSINFESNYSILIGDIYYNRISTDKIKILKEKKTNSTFYLIPSNDNTTFLYLSQLNNKLKELLIDSNKNIYEGFLEFQQESTKELFEFSNTSFRDISYIPQTFKKSTNTIYIPSFVINTHLFSYDFKGIDKNVIMVDKETNSKSYLTSVDEFLNIEFKPDDNINNNFTIEPNEEGKTDFIIRDSFIIGIFDNEIINNNNLPLMQFLYVTKDLFLTKSNYNLENRNE